MSQALMPYSRVHLFNSRLPVIGEAVHQAEQLYQAPRRLVEMAAFGAISTVGQYLVDVKTPFGMTGPVSLALLTIARSGERKSAVERCFTKAIRKNDDVAEEIFVDELSQYEANHSEWKAKRKKLEKDVRIEAQKGSNTYAREQLEGHLSAEPARPRKLQLIYEDVTPIAMLSGLHETGVGALVSSEGAIITEGGAFDSVPHLNALLSGDSIRVTRVGRPSLRITNSRLTISQMVQPVYFEEKTGKKWEKIRGSGHWARYLVCYPESTMGWRFSDKRSHSTDYIDKFNATMARLIARLHDAWENPHFQRDVLEFSSDAADLWVETANQIESMLAPGHAFDIASDHGSKLAEIVARLAALLHLFEGFEGKISIETLRVAIRVCEDCSVDYLNVFTKPPQEEVDAVVLDQFFEKYRSAGEMYVLKNVARQNCPNSLRKERRFYLALENLRLSGKIRMLLCPYEKKELIYLGAPACGSL